MNYLTTGQALHDVEELIVDAHSALLAALVLAGCRSVVPFASEDVEWHLERMQEACSLLEQTVLEHKLHLAPEIVTIAIAETVRANRRNEP